MISKTINKRGIIAKLLEQGIRILLIKECNKIGNIRINIISSSTKIFKGEIQKIKILAKDINYKDLLFDEIELEAHNLEINFKLKTKRLYFKKNPIVKFKIILSHNSLNSILLSKNWSWIKTIIRKEILDQNKLEDIIIKDEKILIKLSKNNNTLYDFACIEINTNNGKIYLKNMKNKENIQIPIEEKIYIENVTIENSLINIIGNSSISF